MVIGFGVLIYLKISSHIDDSYLFPAALILIALSCLTYAALPGVGEISSHQQMLLGQMGVKYRPWMGRAANAVLGLVLCSSGLLMLVF